MYLWEENQNKYRTINDHGPIHRETDSRSGGQENSPRFMKPEDNLTKARRLQTVSSFATSFSRLKTELVYIIFKNSARTSKRTPHLTITKIKQLTLFKEIIAVTVRIIQNP
jgi:hypothetical protein